MLHRTLPVIALLIACLATGLLSAGKTEAVVQQQRTYIVDTTDPDPAGALNTCDFPGVSPDCSLVGAINNANAHVNSTLFGADRINFNIGAGGIKTITPSMTLPQITEAVAIDATGQGPGSDNCGGGIAPCIVIDGVGLSVHASNVSIRGLAIWNVTNGIAIEVASGSNAKIFGNFLGTGDGETRASEDYGVVVADSASNVTIGGTVAADRNVISGSSEGILALGSTVTIEGNYIGTTSDGNSALANGYGIDNRGTNVTIGGTDAGSGNLISGNQNGTSGVGIFFYHAASPALVEGNLIGTNAAGSDALPNDLGIEMQVSSGTIVIGGTTAAARNVISGNLNGIYDGSSGTTIEGNYIGTDITGQSPVPNVGYGIQTDSAYNAMIGGSDPSARNVISGNGGDGISLFGQPVGAPGVTIQNNYIGFSADGQLAPGNGKNGILADSTDPQYGARENVVQDNVIGGNTEAGIHIRGSEAGGNKILDNLIGPDPDQSAVAGNYGGGVIIDGGVPSAVIQGNTIEANLVAGVEINQATASDIELYANDIEGNNADGIDVIGASGVTIGGAATVTGGNSGAAPGGNYVYANSTGVSIQGATANHNRISSNSIDFNNGPGIDLQGGANDGQTAPVLTAALTANGSTHVTGTLTSNNTGPFTIEFFSDSGCNDEGLTYLGSAMVSTTAGVAAIDSVLSPGASGGDVITATAADSLNDTSEFSNCVTVAGPTPTPSPTPSPTHSPTPTPTSGPSHTPTATPSGSLKGDANCDGTVNPPDALAALGYAGGVPPSPFCLDRANVDCDGDVDAIDALRILRWFAGAPMTPPSGCGQVSDPA